jgi:ferric-dicitrate binding protein FerR (iron transport regulator)
VLAGGVGERASRWPEIAELSGASLCTMSIEHTSRGELAAELGEITSLARESLGRMSPEQSVRGKFTVVARFSSKISKRPTWLTLAAAASLAIGADVLVILLLRHRAESAALSYVIDSRGSGDDHSLNVDRGPPRTAHFPDGTEVRAEQGTQARIRFVTNHGAEVAMSRGMIHASVVHSATSEWRFDAGPLVVHVTGTAFSLLWTPEIDRFDLLVEHGSVLVSSPVSKDPLPVRAGQWLTIRPQENEVFIRDQPTPASNSSPSAMR